MICPKCGYDAGEFKFCPECGAPICAPKAAQNDDNENAAQPEPQSDAAETAVQPEPQTDAADIPADAPQTPDPTTPPADYYEAMQRVEKEKAKKKKTKRIGCLGAIVLVMLLLFFIGVIRGARLTPAEKQQAQNVATAIDALPDEIKLTDEDAVEAVLKKYNSLNEKQQKKVKNRKALLKADKTIDDLKVEETEAAIQAIGTVTLDSGDDIAKAQKLYDSLSEDLHKDVRLVKTLEKAKVDYYTLCAKNVVELINGLGTVSPESKDTIEKIDSLYGAFNADQKKLVTNYAAFEAAKAKYNQLCADKVAKQIDALGEVSLSSKGKLEAIEKDYNALSDTQKKLVNNYDAYKKAQDKYDQLAKEDAEKKRIAEIKKTISITSFYVSRPNSAGGVDVHLRYTNKSDKTIKYAIFTVYPYNAVGDMVSSDIGNKTRVNLQDTGPVYSGKTAPSGNSYWDCVWYNYTIKSARLSQVEIIYMDGSTVTIPSEDIQYIKAW